MLEHVLEDDDHRWHGGIIRYILLHELGVLYATRLVKGDVDAHVGGTIDILDDRYPGLIDDLRKRAEVEFRIELPVLITLL